MERELECYNCHNTCFVDPAMIQQLSQKTNSLALFSWPFAAYQKRLKEHNTQSHRKVQSSFTYPKVCQQSVSSSGMNKRTKGTKGTMSSKATAPAVVPAVPCALFFGLLLCKGHAPFRDTSPPCM
jgi:hypothetical protein